ncbi:response regulator transcription factor [Phyllobacterium chamaecytisi]|uniref:response regulator transcription factor n=1 Tax=Phyllobacterium chamaecytisi TaxID=2876082 RepID=UPI001CCC52F1|nr:response regulator [Phyllobacterium sp. KW56]MBZ9601404.1 response regulator [Phyllobacterium sp. KW56]
MFMPPPAMPKSPFNQNVCCVLVADPAIDRNSDLVRHLVRSGYFVKLSTTLEESRSFISSIPISFALIELRFQDGDGFSLIEDVRKNNPNSRILVHSAFCNISVAVHAAMRGATDVLPKPIKTEFVLQLLLGQYCSKALLPDVLPCPNAVRKEHIRTVYSACNHNVARAARALSMHRRTLQRLLERTEMLVSP